MRACGNGSYSRIADCAVVFNEFRGIFAAVLG
jgi:hypothetical protein